MKVSILLSIARQVEGELIAVKAIQGNLSSEKLFKYLRENALPRTEKIDDVDCVIEYGVMEDIEIDE